MIEVKNLSKRFKSKTVLDNISLEIKPGEVHALLGTNGAGKSTLINILSRLMLQDSGEVMYNKSKMDNVPFRNIGFVFDQPLYLSYFSAREYLEFACRLMGLSPTDFRPKIDEIISQFDMPTGRQPIRSYSNGMKSKVSLAAALLGSPEFLILDEPFNGIDFITTREIIKILKNRVDAGTGILITSHQFDIIAELATHFSILHHSNILLSMSKTQLFEEAGKLYGSLSMGEAVKNYVEKVILEGCA